MSPGIYLPCEGDTGHPFNMYWTLGHGLSQSGHLASGLILQCHKFKGVESVSDPALSRNDSCPAGIPFWIRLQILFWDTSSVMAVNLHWTVNSLSLSFQCLTPPSQWILMHLCTHTLSVVLKVL